MQKSYVILDAMELPAVVRNRANKGSKYLTAEMLETINSLQPKQGFVIPLMGLQHKNPEAEQRRLHEWYIKDHFKKTFVPVPAELDAEGNVIKEAIDMPKFTVAVLLPAKDAEGKVVRDGGIAVRRDA